MPIVIVDYDVGNLRSVQKAFERSGSDAIVSREASVVASASALVLPGVGAFAECMANLGKYGLSAPVKDFISSGRPFLGVCVGYQLLFEESEEFGKCRGLGIFPGKCVKFKFTPGLDKKVPHMGWNQARYTAKGRLFDGIGDDTDFYFVHSYYPVPESAITVTTTDYGDIFASSIESGNVFGTQFHPEKSQSAGLRLIKNFAALAGA